MTVKEAIKQLTDVVIYYQGKCTREALDIAINAIKKQIPKKPNDKFNVPYDILACGICPSCGLGVNSDMKFRSECGQAIDWSEGE